MIRPFEGKTPEVEAGFVDQAAVVIGCVVIGKDSSIWPMAVVRGDVQAIEIGCRTNIQDGAILHVTHDSVYTPGGQPLVLGDDITVGHRAALHGCVIESSCLIGMGATVMDAAVIESGAMVAAGALVSPNTRVTGGWLWKGVPARAARLLSDEEQAFIAYSATHYVSLARRHYYAEGQPSFTLELAP